MSKNNEYKFSSKCIHCGKCTRNCTFLSKYDMDLQGFEDREELAYNCFLCGKCKIVCPVDIDGREIAIDMRQKHVRENNGKIVGKGYNGIIWEKKNYPFKNYKNAKKGKSAIFTGCNFLSYLPKTANTLIEKLSEYDIGVIFDCCGKPISELGLEKQEAEIISNINNRLREKNIDELIMVCPNCFYFLKGKLDVKMVDIYSKLEELGIENKSEILKNENPKKFFRPCPDRESNELLGYVSKLANNVELLNEQCCGAGGCASVKERELAKNFRVDIKEQLDGESLFTYCATCVGFFKSENIDARHVLSEILGIKEDSYGNSLLNRVKYKFY